MKVNYIPFSINIRGRLVEFLRPAVMGILNVTPDSFYGMSRAESSRAVAQRVEQLLEEGADIIDVGACSTRSRAAGVELTTEARELERLRMALPVLREVDAAIPVSVDTFRAHVARIAVEELGADIVNDVTGCRGDSRMADTVAALHAPIVLTHSRGDVYTMQSMTDYSSTGSVTAAVIAELSETLDELKLKGVADVIADPGLGFAKTPEQGYSLLRQLPAIGEMLQCPVLVGVSRKSMITVPLRISADDALQATTALNTVALMQGASMLRVHDVKAARQAIDIVSLFDGDTI